MMPDLARQPLLQISLLLMAFGAGWFSHQWLQPLFNPTPVARPGQPLDDVVVVYRAPDTPEHRQQTMRIDSITVLQQDPDRLLLELAYDYHGPAPANEVKIYVGFFSPYLYLGSGALQQGNGKLRLHITTIDRALKAAGVRQFRTESLQISFEHYAPDGYKGVLASTVLPFTKEWSLTATGE